MSPDIALRLATPADAGRIAAMSRDLIEHGLPWRWRPARVAAAIRDPDTNVVVAVGPVAPACADAIEGFGIMSYPDDDAHLLLFAVRAERQRRGVGAAVLAWLEAVACLSGARRIRVEARLGNEAARNFYGEHGYHEQAIARAMYGGVVDGVRLEKWLR